LENRQNFQCQFNIITTLRVNCGTVYCNRSCLCGCVGVCLCVGGWVYYHDVGGLGKYDHVTPVLRDTLHWLPIQQRIKFKVAVLAFDCVRGTCPSYFCGICIPLTEVGGRARLRSAHRGDLCVPSTRTEFGKRSFRVAAPRTCRYISVRQPSADNSSSLGSKLISSNAPTYDFYLRELLRSELTYLLTYNSKLRASIRTKLGFR